MRRKGLVILLCLFMIPSMLLARPSFALVLSGGGARGIAQIAILEELEKRGIVPDYVVGTSIGALIGAFYSAGYSAEEIESLVMDNDLMDIFLHVHSKGSGPSLRITDDKYQDNIARIDFSDKDFGASNGIIDDQYVAAFLRENLSKVLDVDDFDDLSIPFRCIGTDLVTGEELVFSEGSLFDAIRGSMSLPLIFRPARTSSGRYVIDGGMVNNLPTDVARELGADYVLAVDLNNALGRRDEITSETLETLTGATLQFADLITQINSQENYPYADWVVVPSLDDISTMDFYKKEQILEIGRKSVEENQELFDALEKALSGRQEKEVLSYKDRPDILIKSFIAPGLEEFSYVFKKYEGRPFDTSLASSFEKDLQYMKDLKGLKSIYYNIYDGIVYVVGEPYQELRNTIFIGLNGKVGFHINTLGKDVDFSFIPKFNMVFKFRFENDMELYAGLQSSHLFSFYSALKLPIVDNVNFFTEATLGFGENSLLSIPDRIDSVDTDDLLVSLKSGFSYYWRDVLTLTTLVNLEYDYLAALDNPVASEADEDLLGEVSYFLPELSFTAKYNSYWGKNLVDYHVDLEAVASILMRAPFSYGLDFKFNSILPVGIEDMALIVNAEIGTKRYTAAEARLLSSSYFVTKTGLVSRDYAFLDLGGRIRIYKDLYVEFGAYAEGHEGNRPYYDHFWIARDSMSKAPFVMMNDFRIGGFASLGFSTSFGNIALDFLFNNRGEFYAGFSFK